MRAPEFIGRRRLFHQVRGAAGQLATGNGAMAEYVSNAVAQLVADFGDARIGGTAMRAVVASIFHQRYGSRRRAKDTIASTIDGSVESVVHGGN
jgi:hypothetical protein